MAQTTISVAERIRPLAEGILGGRLPVTMRFWDGSMLGPPEGSGGATVVVNSPAALRRLVYAPNELGLGRAYVAGEIDVDGDVFAALAMLRGSIAEEDEHADVHLGSQAWVRAIGAARSLGALGRPLPPPPEEARLHGRRHSKARDAAAISHHYDVSNDFYRLILGETMTYSCGYWADDMYTLDDAQEAKYELICRKLALEPGMRLLDVGCGWGGMVLHAASRYGVSAVGVTLSRRQQELAAKRIADAGLTGQVEVRLQDYRDINDGPYDAISSIGMFEHVGLSKLVEYFETLYRLLPERGRLMNHAISRPAGEPRLDKRSFIERYVFPDGELHEVGTVVSAIQQQGFEVRDVESLREHYAKTLRAWVDNLQSHWDEAVALAGAPRARIWKLYMAGSAINFEANRTQIHQVLAVKSADDGSSAMPPTRAGWFDDFRP